MADRVANLREKVSDKNLVMYSLNGLDTWYKGIAQLIRHSQPLPKFETARNRPPPSLWQPKQTRKDFWTRHILLRCDSSRDLYLVTKPLIIPTTLLSTSSSTWHQRLGHPDDEVLRSLASR
nr:hybrid signal transduction histidine kinase M [Tanacetum cinerariifolium]